MVDPPETKRAIISIVCFAAFTIAAIIGGSIVGSSFGSRELDRQFHERRWAEMYEKQSRDMRLLMEENKRLRAETEASTAGN